jgi:hypothetical protein
LEPKDVAVALDGCGGDLLGLDVKPRLRPLSKSELVARDMLAVVAGLVGRADGAVRLYPRDVIQYRDGARIIERSDRD